MIRGLLFTLMMVLFLGASIYATHDAQGETGDIEECWASGETFTSDNGSKTWVLMQRDAYGKLRYYLLRVEFATVMANMLTGETATVISRGYLYGPVVDGYRACNRVKLTRSQAKALIPHKSRFRFEPLKPSRGA